MGPNAVAKLDHRVPAFGQSTIRSFKNNVSEMKKLAGRDFEDVFQCVGPCFEGLFPKTVDRKIQDLLFTAACWHASAKLRLHTETSLGIFRGLTRAFTKQIRYFANKICPQFSTVQTPSEAATAMCAEAARLKNGSTATVRGSRRIRKEFHINIPKFHSILHYPDAIPLIGTLNGVSTQIGEQEHCRVKRFYDRTNKNQIEKQISQQERRQAQLRALNHSVTLAELDSIPEALIKMDDLPFSDPQEHHHISRWKAARLNLFNWLKQNSGDPATEGFYHKLIDHFLNRLLLDGLQITAEDRTKILLLESSIFAHKVLRINFTTYDNRRDQDSINPSTYSDIIMLHFNSNRSRKHELHRMEFLLVRWYDVDSGAHAGFAAKRLHQVMFHKVGPDTFGFVNPSDVLRAAHLIPNFEQETTAQLLGPSMARRQEEMDLDYNQYYVNMFADRDMFMCFTGGGIGHLATRESTQSFRDEIGRLWGDKGETRECEIEHEDLEPAVENEEHNSEASDTEDARFTSTEHLPDRDDNDWDSELDGDENTQINHYNLDGITTIRGLILFLQDNPQAFSFVPPELPRHADESWPAYGRELELAREEENKRRKERRLPPLKGPIFLHESIEFVRHWNVWEINDGWRDIFCAMMREIKPVSQAVLKRVADILTKAVAKKVVEFAVPLLGLE
ncbi:hypothetical protein AGABI2DRAFT_122544 [Agaricus bisporus var. bisporus H97]|uniref:hypothetical protein n=1 Tax=Agaricus bisporus var. bisporus (strain H97 / ATCC MYA-4626 / FGSC 10389) TaxID=936046 RepID=UPI00029F79E8|nr:hypothetical protein AGABI2DRAFT_122544 [Agaricus bisporus var. bisporus H97]EKV42974.1 hypothetical protein AGABI2DRAFT_122544 [Agaricus bisporus var. bisporus H97]